MTTPKPDPAVVTVDNLAQQCGPSCLSDQHIRAEEIVRAAYAEHMKAAEEMAKQMKYMLYLFDRDLTGDMLGRQVCDDASATLARWRELNPEVEG